VDLRPKTQAFRELDEREPVPNPTSSTLRTFVSGTSSKRRKPNIADRSGNSSYAAMTRGEEKSVRNEKN